MVAVDILFSTFPNLHQDNSQHVETSFGWRRLRNRSVFESDLSVRYPHETSEKCGGKRGPGISLTNSQLCWGFLMQSDLLGLDQTVYV